jgi:hypothetical protein
MIHKVNSEPATYFAMLICAQILYGLAVKIQKAFRIIASFKVSRFLRPNPPSTLSIQICSHVVYAK